MRTAKGRAFQDAIFVRLFRLWAIGREEQVSVLPKPRLSRCDCLGLCEPV